MSSRTVQPIFKDGSFVIHGRDTTSAAKKRQFELTERTWNEHILADNSRTYLQNNFDKIIDTLKNPDYILRSPSEKNVGSFAKHYDDFCIFDKVTAKLYLYVLVNLNNNRIRTIYTNPKLKGWKKIWPRK